MLALGKKKVETFQGALYAAYLIVAVSHVLQPGEPKVRRVTIALRDTIHEVHQHLRILEEKDEVGLE